MPHPSDGSFRGNELRALAEAMPVSAVAAPAPVEAVDADPEWAGFEQDLGWDDDDFSRPIGAGLEPAAIAAEAPPEDEDRAEEHRPPEGVRRRARGHADADPAAPEHADADHADADHADADHADADHADGGHADRRRRRWGDWTWGLRTWGRRTWGRIGDVFQGRGDEGEGHDEAEEGEGEDDQFIYEARSPIRSNRDAWLGVAWVLVFTALVGWATHLFLDKPGAAAVQGASVRLDDMRAVDSAAPTGSVSINDGARRIKVSVIKPETLGGRARSSEDQPEAPYYLSAYTDGELVSGAYGEFAAGNYILMSAVTSARLLYPDSQFGVLLDQLQADDPNLVDPQPVPAGTLAGIARCGESKFADRPMVVCFWADEQCIGVITWIDQPLFHAMEEFLALREQIEHLL
jgi:hypothetical protein